MDLTSMLPKHRILTLGQEIDSGLAVTLMAQLLLLDAENPESRIDLYINSPGGSVTAGKAIIDAMELVSAPISTISIGQAYSMAAWILAAGQKGMRYATPLAEVMIHQTVARYGGRVEDIKVFTDKLMRDEEQMVKMLAGYAGQPAGRIREGMRKDFYVSAEEARDYGLIDDILIPSEKRR